MTTNKLNLHLPDHKKGVHAKVGVQRGQQDEVGDLCLDYIVEMGERLVFHVKDCVPIDHPKHREEPKSMNAFQVGMRSGSFRIEQPLGVRPDAEGQKPHGER